MPDDQASSKKPSSKKPSSKKPSSKDRAPGLWSEDGPQSGSASARTVTADAGPEGADERSGPTTGDNYVDAVDNSPGGDGAASTDGSCPHPNGGTQESSGEESLRGSDLARAALQAAREQSKTRGRGRPPKRGRAGTRNARSNARRRGWSGAGVDDRDPQPLGRVASRIAADQGWSERLAGGQVFGRWAALVGEEISEHTKPVALQEGVLTVQAESTAWATQLRLLQRQIVQRIADGLGQGVVRRIKVQGPAAPSWRYGPRHIPGRGPRDTYG